jgi:putative oxidoreductase
MNAVAQMGNLPPQPRLRFPAHSVAGLAGTSFKPQHLPAIEAQASRRAFFEVHAENYMGAGGPAHHALERIRRDYPISLHGVCMSIGGPQPVDLAHLERFRALVERYEPALVSEHLAWSTHGTTYFNDLLPLPYMQDTLFSDTDRSLGVSRGIDLRYEPRRRTRWAHPDRRAGGRAGHASGPRSRRSAPSAGRRGFSNPTHVGRPAWRGCRRGARSVARFRLAYQHRRHDRSRRLRRRTRWRLLMNMATESRIVRGSKLQLLGVADRAIGFIRAIAPPSFAQLVLRIALAVPFWRSGILKWSGFLQLNDTAVLLFSDEFKLHLPGGPYSFPAPEVMAFMSGSLEILAPVFLVLGLATRFAALALLVMTCIVELTIPDGWPVHITWAAMALCIMAWGPGRWSVDYAIQTAARIDRS